MPEEEITITEERIWFHAKDGLYFSRNPDGSVQVKMEKGIPVAPDLELYFSIPKDTWASILASMSNRGETAETFEEAQEFHNKDG